MKCQLFGLLTLLLVGHTIADISTCGANEKFTHCGISCQQFCDQPFRRYCPYDCDSGCICKPGFVRLTSGGPCVSEKVCSPLCGENEEYKSCGPDCHPSCSNPYKRCEHDCVEDCYCRIGYVRLNENAGSECVLREHCPVN